MSLLTFELTGAFSVPRRAKTTRLYWTFHTLRKSERGGRGTERKEGEKIVRQRTKHLMWEKKRKTIQQPIDWREKLNN